MNNSFVFRFEADDVRHFVSSFPGYPKDHVIITIYAESAGGQAILKINGRAFTVGSGGSSIPVGDLKSGCPVPPCVKIFNTLSIAEKEDCIKELEEAIQKKDS